jgi:cysteine synthase A
MAARGERGSIVTLLCDSGERYAGTYFNDDWLAEQGIDIGPYQATLRAQLSGGH